MNHHESASRGNETTPEKRARYEAEMAIMKSCWGDMLKNDPAYNPNLTLQHDDFSLAWPPRG
jgi:O-antigen biosynthesis protein